MTFRPERNMVARLSAISRSSSTELGDAVCPFVAQTQADPMPSASVTPSVHLARCCMICPRRQFHGTLLEPWDTAYFQITRTAAVIQAVSDHHRTQYGPVGSPPLPGCSDQRE